MSRRIYFPDLDQTVMEEWAKEVGREESEVKEDENNVWNNIINLRTVHTIVSVAKL